MHNIGEVKMKFEYRKYGSTVYLAIRRNADNKQIPIMLNLNLANKEDVITYLEWIINKYIIVGG